MVDRKRITPRYPETPAGPENTGTRKKAHIMPQTCRRGGDMPGNSGRVVTRRAANISWAFMG